MTVSMLVLALSAILRVCHTVALVGLDPSSSHMFPDVAALSPSSGIGVDLEALQAVVQKDV